MYEEEIISFRARSRAYENLIGTYNENKVILKS